MKFLQGTLLKRSRMPIIFAIIAVVVIAGLGLGLRQHAAEAQDGGTIQYGEAKLGVVSSPTGVVYQFEGAVGDAVEVELLGIGGFRPVVAIFDAAGSTVGQNDNDGNTSIINLTVTLPSSGTYTLQVRGRDNANGQFTISLQGTPSATGGGVGGGGGQDGAPTIGQVSPEAPEDSYTFSLNPNEFTKVTVRSLTAGYSPIVRIEDVNGNIVALLNGQFLSGLTIELPPGNGDLKLIVGLGNFGGVAEFGVSISEGIVDECLISTEVEAGINIREGGTDEYAVIGLLLPTDELKAVGQNSGWYQVEISDTEVGWVDGQLVTTEGLCAFLPQTDYLTPDGGGPDVLETEEPGPDETEEPDGTPSSTPTSSYTPTDGPSPTNTNTATIGPSPTRTNTVAGPTFTPSYTTTFTPSYTTTYTPSYTSTFTPSYTPTTPPPAPTAPPDANYNLDVPLDSTGSVTDFVSYPDGDREDRVFFSITGMNPNSGLSGGRARQIIAVSCFGTNTDQVTFFTGGQTYSCGQTIVDREVTADSDTGSILITAIGGQGTYVQWVVTMTATRVN